MQSIDVLLKLTEQTLNSALSNYLIYCVSVISSCPIFHALNSIFCLLALLHSRNTVRLTYL